MEDLTKGRQAEFYFLLDEFGNNTTDMFSGAKKRKQKLRGQKKTMESKYEVSCVEEIRKPNFNR